MPTTLEAKTPRLVTALPGPNAKRVLEQDAKFMSPSYTRDYPLVAKRGHGAIVEDVDGNAFLDFAAGFAVCSNGYCQGSLKRVNSCATAITTQRKRVVAFPSGSVRIQHPSAYRSHHVHAAETSSADIFEPLEGQIFKRLFDPDDVAGIIIALIQG